MLRHRVWIQHLVARVHNISWGGVEGQGNDNIETHKHSTLEIVRLAILDRISHNKDRNSKCHSLDYVIVSECTYKCQDSRNLQVSK